MILISIKVKGKSIKVFFNGDENPFSLPKQNKDSKCYKKILLFYERYNYEKGFNVYLRNKKREKIIEKEFKNELKNYDTRKNNKGF